MLNIVTKEDGLQLEPHDLEQVAPQSVAEEIKSYKITYGYFTTMQVRIVNETMKRKYQSFAIVRDESTKALFSFLFNQNDFFNLLPLRKVGRIDNTLIAQCVTNPFHILKVKEFNFQVQSLENLGESENWKKFSNESSILQSLKYEFITHQFGSFACSTHAVIFTRLCHYGPLHRHIGQLSLNMIRLWFIQTAKAVRYLHFNQIVHRNISSHSIHVRQNLSIELSDFDEAERINNDSNLIRVRSNNGTQGFVAPEIQNANQGAYVEGFKADAYSVGVVFLCLATEETDPRDAFSVVDSGIGTPHLDNDKALESSIEALMNVNVENRADVIQVLQMPDCLRPADELLEDEVDEGFVESEHD